METKLIYREVSIGAKSQISDVILENEKNGWRVSSGNSSQSRIIFERECPLDFIPVYYLIDGDKKLGPFSSDAEARKNAKIAGIYYIEKVYISSKETSRIDRVASLIIDEDEQYISCGFIDSRTEWRDFFQAGVGVIYSSHEDLRNQRVSPLMSENLFGNQDNSNQNIPYIPLFDGSQLIRHSSNTISLDDIEYGRPASPVAQEEIDRLAEAMWESVMTWPQPRVPEDE